MVGGRAKPYDGGRAWSSILNDNVVAVFLLLRRVVAYVAWQSGNKNWPSEQKAIRQAEDKRDRQIEDAAIRENEADNEVMNVADFQTDV